MSEAEAPQFEEDLIKERSESEQLLLYLGGFDGPIDMLLSLARDQKVDLTTISILDLANQYLDFIEKARSVRLELAADYLVMAAWLAYLKSRLLIPQEEQKQAEPSAQELADALQFQLRRLEAMRKVANDLFHLPRLGFNVFSRGEPDGLPTKYISKYEMTYYDLLKAYGDVKQRQQNSVYKLEPVKLFSLEEAIERLGNMLGKVPEEWVSLFMFLPGGLEDGKIVKRSAIASTFGGALEMVKRGLLELQQEQNYATIYIRRPVPKDGQAAPAAEDAGNGMSEAAEAGYDDSFDEPIDPSQTVEAEMAADEEAEAARKLAEHLEQQAGTEAAAPETEVLEAEPDAETTDETKTLNEEA
ncbi:MAG: segregation/condensation protein A [Alphaproteobacteria bacterium]|nr:segregation/condensation protein A [Alphaproteobacteria bacterium]